jgi:uncharacterized protein YeaO (DUF488 family)
LIPLSSVSCGRITKDENSERLDFWGRAISPFSSVRAWFKERRQWLKEEDNDSTSFVDAFYA